LIYRFSSIQNQEEFIKHLKQIIKKYFNKKIFIYLDNAGWHKGKKVKKFLENQNIRLIFLPPYSPQLNPVERFWKFMRKNVTHNHFYELVSDFEDAVKKFFKSTKRNNIKKKIYTICRNI
jgi:transposase